MPAVGSIASALAASTFIEFNGLVQARLAMMPLGVRGVDVQPMRPPVGMVQMMPAPNLNQRLFGALKKDKKKK